MGSGETYLREDAMAQFELGPGEALFYDHHPPSDPDGKTFVFFNALTGDTSNWEGVICPKLREAGHGTLAYNLRGQANSPFSPTAVLDAASVVDDAVKLLNHIDPVNPVMVGLSIGGLFGARAWLQGAKADGLVLINTLRQDGPRLQWIGDALVRAAEVGGLELFRDLYLPLLFNEQWLGQNRDNFLKDGGYTPLDKAHGHYKLLAEAGRTADWDLPLEKFELPVLVITGLQDHVFLDLEVVAGQGARLPNASRIDMADAAHLIPAERPAELTQALLTFAREV